MIAQNEKPAQRTVTEWLVSRYFEAAETHRLNASHWANASDTSINDFLFQHLSKLRARTTLEARNNPIVEGVINTYCDDVVGEDGPSLQIESESDAWNEALESLWADWWAMPDARRQMTGVDMLRQWQRMRWTAGEYLFYTTLSKEKNQPIRLRVLNVHPRRLDTPMISRNDIFMGVEYDEDGVAVAYHIQDDTSRNAFSYDYTFRRITVDRVFHRFLVLEPDQVRGLPILSSALSTIADVRDWDTAVVDQMKFAASISAYMKAVNATTQAEYDGDINVPIERNVLASLPPGWDFQQIQPAQPNAQYSEFYDYQHRKIGRPAGMPGNLVLLDSKKHNYSSARFDGQGYSRALRVVQRSEARKTLSPLVRMIAEEGVLSGVLPEPPKRWRTMWTWQGLPHVDPEKEANAATIRLSNGTTNPIDECAAVGVDFYDNATKQRAALDFLTKLGLPLPQYLAMPTKPETEENAGNTDDA